MVSESSLSTCQSWMNGWMDVRWVALDTASSESGGMECLGVFVCCLYPSRQRQHRWSICWCFVWRWDKTWFNIQEIKAWRVALPLAGSALMNLLFYILSSTQPEKISKETPRQRIVTLTHWQLWKFRTPSALCFLYTVLSQCCFLQCVHLVSCNVFTTLNLMSLYPILQIALSRHFSVYIVLHVCTFIYIIYVLIFVECLWDQPCLA